MKTSRNPLSHYTNALGKAEMKSYLAGNSYVPGFAYFIPTLPEVTVYSTRPTISSEIDKYFRYMMFSSNSNNFSGVNGWSGGGSVGSGTHGFTFDTIHHLLNQGDNLAILKRLGKQVSIIGIVLGLTEILDHYSANNGNLSTNDCVTLALTFTTIAILLANTASALWGLGTGLVGLGFDIYKASK